MKQQKLPNQISAILIKHVAVKNSQIFATTGISQTRYL